MKTRKATTEKTHTYWISESLSDHKCYNIRGERKLDVVRQLKENGYSENGSRHYSKPRKVSVKYTSLHDLMSICLSEDRGWWETEGADT